MVWESQVAYSNPLLVGQTIIHGHRPVTADFCKKQIEVKHQVINIDTGCVYKDKIGYGKLTAIEFYSQYNYIHLIINNPRFAIRESRIRIF